MRLIIGISGASGVILDYEMLKVLHQLPNMEVHLVVSEGAMKNFQCETDLQLERCASTNVTLPHCSGGHWACRWCHWHECLDCQNLIARQCT